MNETKHNQSSPDGNNRNQADTAPTVAGGNSPENQPMNDPEVTTESNAGAAASDSDPSQAPHTETPVGDSQSPTNDSSVTAQYSSVDESQSKRPVVKYILGALIILLAALAVLFLLERDGQVSTGLFSEQSAGTAVAVVNGEEINRDELQVSIDQFNEAAIAQGVDVSNPDVKADIRDQSLEVIINTELLMQEAAERGITASEEAAQERLGQLEVQLGGPEELAARIEELGLTRAELEQDIQDELVIQTLLDELLSDVDLSVSDEEVAAVYEQAGGSGAELPALEEVRPQIEEQVRATKEQEAVDAVIADLRSEAEINVVE